MSSPFSNSEVMKVARAECGVIRLEGFTFRDHFLTMYPIRQVILSFPFPIRFWMAKNPKLQSEILTITIRAVSGLLRKKAKSQGLKQRLEYAVVTVIQRFGGSIILNPHLHKGYPIDDESDISEQEEVTQRCAVKS